MFDYIDEYNQYFKRRYLDDQSPRVPPYPHEDLQLHTGERRGSFAELVDRSQQRGSRDGRLAENTDHYPGTLPSDTQTLRDTILALQIQNRELSIRLEGERRQREKAEAVIERDKKHIDALEETIKSLKTSRLVIEPNMYRQIAETYMASRRTPVRRTCSSNVFKNYEDLVCDTSSESSPPPSPADWSLQQSAVSPPSSSSLDWSSQQSSVSHPFPSSSNWNSQPPVVNHHLKMHPPVRLPSQGYDSNTQYRPWSPQNNKEDTMYSSGKNSSDLLSNSPR